MKKYAPLVIALAYLSGSEASAQGADAFMGIVGGMMAAAQAQAAQADWARLPDVQRYCVEQSLSRKNASINQLTRAGIGPADPRLRSITSECSRFDATKLKVGFKCNVVADGGAAVTSTCNQAFVRARDASAVTGLGLREAIDAYFSGEAVVIKEFETDNARSERADRAARLRRQADLSVLKQQLEAYRNSRSDVVRTQYAALSKDVASAIQSSIGPSEVDFVRLQGASTNLNRLAAAEANKLLALEKVATLKEQADRRAADPMSEFRDEAAQLSSQYQALLKRPAGRAETPKPQTIGPAFDCMKAKIPLEIIVCSDPALKRLDIELLQPYYVLRFEQAEFRDDLKQEAIDATRKVLARCKIGASGPITAKAVKAALPCVTEQYRSQRDIWRSKVVSEAGRGAMEESVRPLAEHVRLQELLIRAGYVQNGGTPDGIYGGSTRAAISAFQSAQGLPSTGLMTSETATRLSNTVPAVASGGFQEDAGTIEAINQLQRRYIALNSQIDSVDAKRNRELQAKKKIAEARIYLDRALSLRLPAGIEQKLKAYADALKLATDSEDNEALNRLAFEFDALQPSVNGAVQVAGARTDKNAFITEGDPLDIIVLYNDTGKAPKVVKNLRGELVFDGGAAVMCRADAVPLSIPAERELNERFRKWSISLPNVLPRCQSANLTGNDLILISRGGILKEQASEVVALQTAVDAGAITQLFDITKKDLDAAEQKEALAVLDIDVAVEKQSRQGFGILKLNADNQMLCFASIQPEDRNAHQALIIPALARLQEAGTSNAPVAVMSADAAFVASKRGQCGYVYANAADLKQLTTGMKRDATSFRYLAVWINPDQIEAQKKLMAEVAARESKLEVDSQRRREDMARLEAAKQNEAGVLRAQKQEALQRQYGAMARGFEGKLATEMKALFENRDERSRQKYSNLSAWYDQQQAGQWELMSIDTELADYGIAEFKSRSLETGFARTKIKLRNRRLGEYKEQCFATGFMADVEFKMEREAIGVPCEQVGVLASYKSGRQFISRWLVN